METTRTAKGGAMIVKGKPWWRIFNWRYWMSDDKVMLKIQMEKDLRGRVEAASEREGMTMSAWVRKAVLQALPAVVEQNPTVSAANGAMEAAFETLDQRMGESDYPAVMPLPPAPMQPTAPIAEKVQPKVSVNAVPKPPVGAAAGHSCANYQETKGMSYAAGIQGTCAAQGGRVCHWASHTARECPAFKARWARVPGMQPLR